MHDGMEKSQSIFNRKQFIMVCALAGLLLLGGVLGVSAHSDLQNAEKQFEDTISYVKEQCTDYDNLNLATETKSLMRMMENAQHLCREIAHDRQDDPARVLDDAAMAEYLRDYTLSGALVLSTEGKILCAASQDGRTADLQIREQMEEQLAGSIVLKVADHPEQVYAGRSENEDGSYVDTAACARKDGDGVLVVYYRTTAEYVRNYNLSYQNCVQGYNPAVDGTIVVTRGDRIVASNDTSLLDTTVDDNPTLSALKARSTDGGMIHVHSTTGQQYAYGIVGQGRSFYIYVYRPEQEVYVSTMRNVSMAAFTGLLMLTRRSYMFTVAAFFVLYGVWVLVRAALQKQGTAALRFVKFAVTSLICVGVPLVPMFWRIVKADYSDRYATYQTGGFLAELDHQRVYLGYFIGILFVIGILYAAYKKQTRFLTVLSAAGSVLTVFLVTKVQNMDDHQSLAVAPFYLLGLYMLALLAANLPGKWLRRALAALVSVGCAINFAGCSQLMPIKLPGAWYSGLFFTIDNERTDMAQIAEVNDFLRENCEGDNSAYMICHGLTYSADVFRAAALPDESIRSILAYGAVNPGNDAFPKELFTAQIVLTCTPFDPSNHTEKINSAFLENVETLHCFEVAAEFDMGNGYTITAYRRVKAPAVAELDAYRRWLAEEDEQFPYNFSAVWDQLETELANNG